MPFGRIVRGRKFQQVLEGARKVFLRDGFSAASVDAIAQEAGVSKATLYSYFPEKRVMLIEVARVEFERVADRANETLDYDQPTSKLLEDLALAVAQGVTSELSIQVFRLAVAETPRFPALGREYYRAGPGMLNDRIAGVLKWLAERGDLEIEDTALAAAQFAELASARIHDLCQFGMRDQVTPELIEQTAKAAARVFLRGYGTDKVL